MNLFEIARERYLNALEILEWELPESSYWEYSLGYWKSRLHKIMLGV